MLHNTENLDFILPYNFVSGPSFVPIVGNLFTIRKLCKKFGSQHLAFNHLNEIYKSNVLGLKFGNELTIVVSSYPLVRQVFVDDIFLGRPDNFFMKLRSMGKRIGESLWQVSNIMENGQITMEQMICGFE